MTVAAGRRKSWWEVRRRRRPSPPVSAPPDDRSSANLEPSRDTTFPAEPSADRLRRLAHWCTHGQVAGAELDLYEWQRHDDCPALARTLLAGLLAQRGATQDAMEVLDRAHEIRNGPDAQLTQLHIAVMTAAGFIEPACQQANRLRQDHGNDPAIAAWVRTMQLTDAGDLPLSDDSQITDLTAELVANPQVIPSLVAALKTSPQDQTGSDVALMRQALALMIRDVHDDQPQMLTVCQALAELALMARDNADAHRWAHRGLRINPFAATLALVLIQSTDETRTADLGTPAAEVLQGAIQAHPTYPDLRAALVRHKVSRGRVDEARLDIEHWLHDQPDQPLARRLQRELAA